MASVITHPTRITKSRDVLIRIGSVAGVNRPSVSYKQNTDRTVIERIDNGRLAMYEFQGATTGSYAINDDETKFRYIGDAGWGDGVITNSRVTMSATAHLLKNLGWGGDPESPNYFTNKGSYDEGTSIIQKFKNNKETEAWIEVWKFIDTIDGGVSVYDVACFAGVVMNYKESYPADGLVETSFDVESRGEAYMGLFDAINPIRTGLPNLATKAGAPTLDALGNTIRYVRTSALVSTVSTPIPLTGLQSVVDNASPVTFTYLDSGEGGEAASPLTGLSAAPTLTSKPLARIVKASDKTFVPASIAFNSGAGTVVLTPLSPLEYATEFYAEIATGAVIQTIGSDSTPLVGVRSGSFVSND